MKVGGGGRATPTQARARALETGIAGKYCSASADVRMLWSADSGIMTIAQRTDRK
jgi:hypothetical protein